MLFALGNRPRIPIAHTLSFGDNFRVCLMGLARRTYGDDAIPSGLLGRRGGTPACGHQHCRYLPLDLDGTGHVDHVLVDHTACARTVAVLEQLSWIRYEGVHLDVTPVRRGDLVRALERPSTCLVSTTPYVLTRHPKTRGGKPRLDDHGRWIDGPEWQLRAELERLGLPTPIEIRPTSHAPSGVPWKAFAIRRSRGGGRRGPNKAFGFAVTFTKPVRGPICVGYGAHFGLGQFWPTTETDHHHHLET